MTAHTITLHDNTHADLTEMMATIIPFHVEAAPGRAEPDLAVLAVARLKTFLAEEGSGLARVLSLLALSGAQADLEALGKLLREAADTMQPLAEAESLLERLVEDLADVAARTEIQRPMEAGEEVIVRNLDAWVRWLGARTEEMLNLVRHVQD